ncbi:unnamed protein product [Staurois parvus]|uniref:Uncharacterized protein n=1 Tax=Staurois parvus TaxID=386267 RepID=A0ABN9AM50_9NEOB|nr:unnamed protein product [Staurois parvus]
MCPCTLCHLQAVEFTVVFFERTKIVFRSRFYQRFKRQMLVNTANHVYKHLRLQIFF